MIIQRPHGDLFYTTVDATAPWVEDPETILFLHGVAVTHAMWANWIPRLAPRYRLAMLDTRGFGQSGGMRDPATWTLDDVSDDLLAVAYDLGLDTFHVVGESLGGTAVLNLATRALPQVRSATILSTAHRGYQIDKVKAWRHDLERDGVAQWSAQMMERRFVPGAISEVEHAWFQRLQDETPAEALACMGELLMRTDLTPRLDDVTCPVLVIAPDQSPFVGPEIPAEIVAHLHLAELRVLNNTRHGIFFSHGDECAALLLDFLGRKVPG